MSRFHEEIRQTLLEVETFLLTSLSNTPLSSSAKLQKDSILQRIDKLRTQFTSLLPPKESTDRDVSGGTIEDGSSGSASGLGADVDEQLYSENITAVAASDLYNITKSGFIGKRRKPGSYLMPLRNPYQNRWCVLKSNIFYYYEKQTDKKQAGAFCVSGYEFRDAPFLLEKEPNKKELSFELLRPGHRVYQFLAIDKDDYQQWKEVIEKASAIPERAPPQVPSPSPKTSSSGVSPASKVSAGPDEFVEELYEPLDDDNPNADIRPVSEELYDDIPGDDLGDVSFSSGGASSPVKKIPPQVPAVPPPQLPSSPPPQLPTQTPPQLPSRIKKDDPVPELPPRNPTQKTKTSDDDASNSSSELKSPKVVFPEFTAWKLGDWSDFENIYYGKWDCDADDNNELSFKQGDIMHVLSKDYDTQQWWIAELDGNVGLVPRIFLTEAYQLVS